MVMILTPPLPLLKPTAHGSWAKEKNERDNKTFIGAERVLNELQNGASRKRVGIRLTGKGVAREGAEVFDAAGEKQIGVLTSGGFSPTLKTAIGQAYVETAAAIAGTKINIRVRGTAISKPKLPTCRLLRQRLKKN